jgi:ubiquitin carboxyl-terminal hydrolase 8
MSRRYYDYESGYDAFDDDDFRTSSRVYSYNPTSSNTTSSNTTYTTNYNYNTTYKAKEDDDKNVDYDKISEERKKVTVRGLSGLSNQGNTCYMNSALQCLSALNLLRSWLINDNFAEKLQYNIVHKLGEEKRKKNKLSEDDKVVIKKSDIEDECQNSIVYRLTELIKMMWKQNATVTPKSFKQVLGDKFSTFRGYGQQDSQELINVILDKIHEETKTEVSVFFSNVPQGVTDYLTLKMECNKKINDDALAIEKKEECLIHFKKYKKEHINDVVISDAYTYWKKYIKDSHSIITDLFTGLFFSKITCKECGKISGSFEAFTILQVPVTDNDEIKLEECINSFVKEEILTDTNKYFCEDCNKNVDAIKNVYIWELPNILVVHLKRYDNTSVKTNHKNSAKVTFPIKNLDLKEYLSDLHTVNNTEYDLCAISDQRGSLTFGHYVAYCKNGINNKWYEFNDNDVIHVPDDELEKEIVTKNAYILFYERKL